jgi:hypothetical protein
VSSTVFIGGSRFISRLPTSAIEHLARTVDEGLAVVVGDANGADKAVQRYLAERQYPRVTVYCMRGECRNNLGDWPVQEVDGSGRRGYDYYSLKDVEMAAAADQALMIWDQKSRGTFANLARMVQAGKPALVYLAPAKEWREVRGRHDLVQLRDLCALEDAAKLTIPRVVAPGQPTLFMSE